MLFGAIRVWSFGHVMALDSVRMLTLTAGFSVVEASTTSPSRSGARGLPVNCDMIREYGEDAPGNVKRDKKAALVALNDRMYDAFGIDQATAATNAAEKTRTAAIFRVLLVGGSVNRGIV